MADGHQSEYSDAANRCSEAITLALLAGRYGQWIAIRLSDGGQSGVTYDDRASAIRDQLHETQCCYIRIPMGGMSVREAERFMAINRELYENGMHLIDPDKPDVQVILPRRTEMYR